MLEDVYLTHKRLIEEGKTYMDTIKDPHTQYASCE